MEIRLRPHHLLCIQKFIGRGYDGAFTNRLAEIVGHLSANPDTKITLAEGCDEVCIKCPNNRAQVCTDGEKVIFLDEGVLEACNLKYGATDTWDSLSRTARERVFDTDNFERICGCCQWFDICKNKTD